MRNPGINLKYGVPMLVAVFIASTALLYGGAQLVKEEGGAAAQTGGTQETVPGGPANITIVAQSLKWDKNTITVSADAPVTVTMDNRDAGVLHNIAFYTNRQASQKIFASEPVTGPTQQVSTFTAPPSPGNFFFRCDVHTDMTGTFVVQ